MSVFIGIDIGGTFTDCVVSDPERGLLRAHKQLTSPSAPERGVLEGARSALAAASVDAGSVAVVLHATTLATNAILERRGARVGFVTTEGFRDVLIVGREHRYDMQDLLIDLPRPLVSRSDILEVPERTDVDGNVLHELDVPAFEHALDTLRDRGIDTVAVGFLHSYRNPANEQAARLAAERASVRYVSVSHEIAPVIREYERFSTIAANAYVQPILNSYLEILGARLVEMGVDAPMLVMLSNGGLCMPEDARSQPVRVIESGPAAGVMAAVHVARGLRLETVLSFDMGGTTAKGCIIRDGAPGTNFETEVARLDRFKAGSGLPLAVPSIDLIEVGAGGGSIAAVDAVGRLRVGPRSAGAAPGPACYGQGGTEPTVTDADLVLGYLNPHLFAGHAFELDRAAAEEAIRRAVAEPLGISVAEAAWGIHTAVNQNMASAFRIHAIERDVDIRQYPVVAFGGAGPVHATALAEALGTETVVVPYTSSVLSALGLIETPPAFEAMQTFQTLLDQANWDHLAGLFDKLEAECAAKVGRASPRSSNTVVERAIELRYVGQQRQLLVAMPETNGGGTAPLRTRLHEAFQREYRARYMQEIENVPLEIVNVRVKVVGASLTAETPAAAPPDAKLGCAEAHARDVWFDAEHPSKTRSVAWSSCDVGQRLEGPACLEHENTVVVVRPGWAAEIGDGLDVVLRRMREGA